MIAWGVILTVTLLSQAIRGEQPPAFFDKIAHDFGIVSSGPSLTHNCNILRHDFRITNGTLVPLTLSVRTPAGCVYATPSAQVLQPRGVAVITVAMDSRRFEGPKTVNVYVSLTAPNNRITSLVITVSANVCRFEVVDQGRSPRSDRPVLPQASLTVLPGTVTLGSLKAGESMTKPLLVKGAKPFRIMSIEGLGEGIQSDLPATAATLHKLTLQCQPAQPGEFRRQLRIKTDLDGESAVTVTVVGEVVP